jgi:hypothetical protein
MKRQQAREEAFLMLCESGFDAERTAAEAERAVEAAREDADGKRAAAE